eukprot:gene17992-biopygen11564
MPQQAYVPLRGCRPWKLHAVACTSLRISGWGCRGSSAHAGLLTYLAGDAGVSSRRVEPPPAQAAAAPLTPQHMEEGGGHVRVLPVRRLHRLLTAEGGLGRCAHQLVGVALWSFVMGQGLGVDCRLLLT